MSSCAEIVDIRERERERERDGNIPPTIELNKVGSFN